MVNRIGTLKKALIVVTMLLILQSLALADDTVSQIIPLNVTVGETVTFDVEISNTAHYKLWDVQFTSANTIMTPIDIEPNSTGIATITYTSVVPGTYSETLSMVGYNKISCVDAPTDVPTEITINSSGVFPSEVSVCTNTEVIFYNTYTDWIQLKVYPEDSFGEQILSGSDTNRVFNNVGNYAFEVLPILVNGMIHVNVDDVLVHSNAGDISLQLDIVSSYLTSDLSIGSVDKNDFIVNANEFDESFFIINNVGSEKARGINFVGDNLGWFSFDPSVFDLESGSSKAVNFVVKPLLFNTSDTNKTYNFSIGIESLNSDTINVDFSVFVPFVEVIDTDNISSSSYWYHYWMEELGFCESNPTAPQCSSEALVVNTGDSIGCPNILLNMSSEKLYDYLIQSLKGQSTSEKAFNMIKVDLDDRKVFRAGMVNLTNVTNNELAVFSKRVDNLEGSFSAIIIGILIVLIVCVLGFIGYQFYLASVREGKDL